MKKALSLLALAAVIAAVAVPVSSQALVIRDGHAPAHERNGLVIRDSVQTALVIRDDVQDSETTTEPTGETLQPTTDDQGLVIRDGYGLVIRDGNGLVIRDGNGLVIRDAQPEPTEEEVLEPTTDDQGLVIRDAQDEPAEEEVLEPTTDDRGLVIRDGVAAINGLVIRDSVETALVIRDPDPNGKKAKEPKDLA